jgi:5'-nucleotidase
LGLLLAHGALSAPQLLQSSVKTPGYTLTILHTNDVHARLAPYYNNWAACVPVSPDCLAGAARLAARVKELRQTEPNPILVDAGDQFQGTLYYKLFKADVITRTMNALTYTAMAVGNHEFDDGPAMLGQLADGVNFPVLGTNLDVSAEPTLAGKLPVSTVITVGGERIGLIGLTTPEAASSSSPGPNVVFKDVALSASQAVSGLQAMGVNKIIALTHLGYQEDLALAQAVDGLDVIIGGHSHTFIYSPTTPVTFTPPIYPSYGSLAPEGEYPTPVYMLGRNPVLVATDYQWATFLGHLKVTFDPSGTVTGWEGSPVYLGSNITPDPDMAALLAPYDVQVQAEFSKTVGVSHVDLPLAVGGKQVCRLGECLLGDLVTDAMLWRANSTQPGRAPGGPAVRYQIAIQNGGGLRASLVSGTLSVGSVEEVLPFGNSIATFEITGSYLISALNSGLSKVGGTSSTGRFPQVAGLRFAFAPNGIASSRLISVEVNTGGMYAPLDPDAHYFVVTNDYVRGGGDGYTLFKTNAINPYDFGPPLDEAVMDYIKDPLSGEIWASSFITGRILPRLKAYFPILLLREPAAP